MINGEITAGVAPDAIGAKTQLKRLVFQTPGLDEQSGHVIPPKPTNFAPAANASRAENEVQPAIELWR
jgi:hypothetical protein